MGLISRVSSRTYRNMINSDDELVFEDLSDNSEEDKKPKPNIQSGPIDLTEDDDEFADLCSQIEDEAVRIPTEDNTPNFDNSSVVSSTQYTQSKKAKLKNLPNIPEGRENNNKRPREEPESKQKSTGKCASKKSKTDKSVKIYK